jgi:hypothetical protein
MGGGGSKTLVTSEVVTNIMSSITARTMQNCTTNVLANQHLVVANVSDSNVDGVAMRQSFKVNISCKVTNQLVQDLRDSISSAIAAENSQVTQAVMGAINALAGETTVSNMQSSIANQISRDISVDLVQNIVNNINLSQDLIIRDISQNAEVQNISLEQTIDYIMKSMAESYSKTELVSEIQNQEAQASSQGQENPIAGVISSAGSAINEAASGIGTMLTGPMMSLFLLMLVVIVAYILAKKFLNGGGDIFNNTGNNNYNNYNDYDYDNDNNNDSILEVN